MEINIKYLANLCRIFLTESEEKKIKKDFEKILQYISQLQKIDTEGVKPSYHVIPITNVFREDKIEESLPLEETLKNAPSKSNNFFKVPKII